MGSNREITAEYVMLQLSIFKKDLLSSIKDEMRSVVKEELEEFRNEIDKKISDVKLEHEKLILDQIEEVKLSYQIKEAELEERINRQQQLYEDTLSKYQTVLNRCVEAEDRQRRLNIVISNLPADNDLTCIENAEKFFINNLKIPKEKVNSFIYRNSHYLGKEQNGKGRSLIVAFVRQTDRDFVMSHGKNLQGSNISLKQNYSPETRAKKDEMLNLKKSLSTQNMKLRVVERNYRPTLQILGPNNRWSQYEEEY